MRHLCFALYRQGLVGETALYTRIADVFIRHPEYFFGEPPVLPVTAQLDEPQTPSPSDDLDKTEEFDFGVESVSTSQSDNDISSNIG